MEKSSSNRIEEKFLIEIFDEIEIRNSRTPTSDGHVRSEAINSIRQWDSRKKNEENVSAIANAVSRRDTCLEVSFFVFVN